MPVMEQAQEEGRRDDRCTDAWDYMTYSKENWHNIHGMLYTIINREDQEERRKQKMITMTEAKTYLSMGRYSTLLVQVGDRILRSCVDWVRVSLHRH
ncbi:hypothetical protein QE152_g37098 [Popillia japonica]|uniref:Uncharacterized protein n=1 Tax=Popillia japonica TaxID=7064 RepID=A0AAW1IAL3_POPJA